MKLTPAIKGQLTKVSKTSIDVPSGNRYRCFRTIFAKVMPAEQAKHAARHHLAKLQAVEASR